MAYVIEAADPKAHRTDILKIWEGSLRTGNADHYRWVYEDNPFGPVSCWIVRETETDTVVGTAAVMPRFLTGMGRRWRAGMTIDFAVSKAHRTLTAALMLQKAAVSACTTQQYELLYGFPNDGANRVQLRAGFMSLAKPTEIRKTFRSTPMLARRYGVAGRVGGRLVDVAFQLADRAILPAAPNTLRFSETATFDGRFDDFWARVGPQMPLTGERTSAYLNWRFGSCPHTPYRALVMEHATGGEIAGYAVWSAQNGEALIGDLVADPSQATIELLTAELLRRLRPLGLNGVRARYFGSLRLPEAQRRLGFRTADSSRGAVICVGPDTPLREALIDRDNWYLLDGDTDL